MLDVQSTESISASSHSIQSAKEDKFTLWHQQLGHCGERQLKDTMKEKLVKGVSFSSDSQLPFCDGYTASKQCRKLFKSVSGIWTTKRLQLVHSDLCGLMQTKSIGGAEYILTFMDDYSRSCRVYFMKCKEEMLEKFKEYEAQITNETGLKMKRLQTDKGGEFTSESFEAFL